MTLGELVAPLVHRQMIAASAVKTQLVAQGQVVPNGPPTGATTTPTDTVSPAMASVNYGNSLQGNLAAGNSYGVYNALGMGFGTTNYRRKLRRSDTVPPTNK